MRLLAIDTSSNACSVALGIDGEQAEAHVVEPREHTRILMPMIARLLASAGLAPRDLDAVVLGNGPGSFIGMRIGASVAQGICFAADLKLVPVSSLAAVAAEALTVADAERVVVTQDARMNEVYVGEFLRGNDDLPRAAREEYISPVATLDLGNGNWVAAGGGWDRYPALFDANRAQVAAIVDVSVPRAGYLLKIAESDQVRPIPPTSLAPAYLRQKVAEAPSPKH